MIRRITFPWDWSKWVAGIRCDNQPYMRFIVLELGPTEVIIEWDGPESKEDVVT